MPLRSGLINASVPLLGEVETLDELGRARHIYIPGEHPLTVYLDECELVTLMALDGMLEVLVLGYLHNQRLVSNIEDIASIRVDWEIEPAAMSTRAGVADLDEETTRRIMTTGCGQGIVFGLLMDEINTIHLSPDVCMTQTTLYRVVDAIRLQQSTYKQVGSVHDCALFDAHGQLLYFTENMGCHNAVDAIADHMWLGSMEGGDKVLYIIGCLTSEMAIKDMQMGIPFLLSRSSVTQMGRQVAQRVNLTLFVRCTGRCSLFYTEWNRFVAESGVADMVGPHGELPQVMKSGR